MVLLTLAIILSLTAIEIQAQASVSTTYSGTITTSSQYYTRKGATGTYYYQAIQVQVPVTGEYTFQSSSTTDTYGYIYQGNFYPTYPQYNVVGEDDESGGSNNFKITASLRSDITYYLIVTTYHTVRIGSYVISASGPNYPTMTSVSA